MIKVDHLYFQYDEKSETIKDISLHIPKGKWISILGHNGSGKSTLAKLLVGLYTPLSGQILIDGIVLSEETLGFVRKKLGIVFQNPDHQFVGVTVRHDIAFGLENHQIKTEEIKARVLKYAQQVGMEKYLYQEPQHLSGGQKQRVAIAGALALHQEAIIFDEATSMLDPQGVKEVTELIRQLNQEHQQTVITITHDLNFALQSDYAFILKEGSLLAQGQPFELFSNQELLESSMLKIPEGLKLYHEVKNDPTLGSNQELVAQLWEYNTKK